MRHALDAKDAFWPITHNFVIFFFNRLWQIYDTWFRLMQLFLGNVADLVDGYVFGIADILKRFSELFCFQNYFVFRIIMFITFRRHDKCAEWKMHDWGSVCFFLESWSLWAAREQINYIKFWFFLGLWFDLWIFSNAC